MIYTYDFSYLSCQSCSAKIHCSDCAEKLRERLERTLASVQIDMPNGMIRIEADNLPESDLLDLLEDAGVFAG